MTEARHDRASSDLPARAAALILDAFLDYNGRFADITRRARRCFERRDWRHARADAIARIDLYEGCLQETLGRAELLLEERIRSRPLWAAIRQAYAAPSAALPDGELARTYFNSLSRRYFNTVGVDPQLEFVTPPAAPPRASRAHGSLRRYRAGGDLAAACERLLADAAFAHGYADLAGCARAVAARLAAALASPPRSLEVLSTVFYRERRAYLVGRALTGAGALPMVVALASTIEGARADALLTEAAQVSVLFGFARSYFHADLPVVADAVAFLHALLPHKPIDEIYTILGRAKQGKTERYRRLFAHFAAHPDERLVHADGDRGMVMAVFTPPSFPVVFKVIRDRFAYPKAGERRQVQAKYDLVFRYDRVGRLIDAQEFRHLHIPVRQFDPALLQELLQQCSESVALDGAGVLIRHCYIERRLRPLNLYVREAPPPLARQAVLDYGQAIRDLACSNIFPGDLLAKNFGVSRHGRAIFYDYDELCLVEDCRFRRVPEAREEDETRSLEDWLSVGDNDVFPELFPRFLGLPPALHDALLEAHPQLFDPGWWQALQARLRAGEYVDVPPYPEVARL